MGLRIPRLSSACVLLSIFRILVVFGGESTLHLLNSSLICAAPYTKKEGLSQVFSGRAPTLQRETLCSQNLGVFPGWLNIPPLSKGSREVAPPLSFKSKERGTSEARLRATTPLFEGAKPLQLYRIKKAKRRTGDRKTPSPYVVGILLIVYDYRANSAGCMSFCSASCRASASFCSRLSPRSLSWRTFTRCR